MDPVVKVSSPDCPEVADPVAIRTDPEPPTTAALSEAKTIEPLTLLGPPKPVTIDTIPPVLVIESPDLK